MIAVAVPLVERPAVVGRSFVGIILKNAGERQRHENDAKLMIIKVWKVAPARVAIVQARCRTRPGEPAPGVSSPPGRTPGRT